MYPSVEIFQLDSGACTDAQNDSGQTPLLLAVRGGYHDIMDLLIHRGCSVNKSDKSVLVKLFVPLFHLVITCLS